MKILSDDEIIQMIREEWTRKLKKLSENIELSTTSKVDGEEKFVISPGLKIMSKNKDKSKRQLYTVEEISPVTVRLSFYDKNGAKKFITINNEKLEQKYDLQR